MYFQMLYLQQIYHCQEQKLFFVFVDYQFELPLIIIQRASTLKKAQEELKTKTKYYKHYKY